MTTLEIEVVDIRKASSESNSKAFADIKIGGCLIVKGLSVLSGKRGLFVSMPKRQGREGKWFEMLSAVNDDFKRQLQDKVLEAYDRETDGVDD